MNNVAARLRAYSQDLFRQDQKSNVLGVYS